MIRDLFIKLKNNKKIDKVLGICLIVSLSIYIFSLPSFSGREKYNLVSYIFMGLSGAFVLIKCILYKPVVFDTKILIIFFFAAEALIGTMIYSHEYKHWLTILLLSITLVIFYYSFCIIDNKRLLLKIIGFSLLSFGIYFAIHYRANIISFNLDEPIKIFFDNPNTLGTYFSLSSSVFLYLALSSKKKVEWLYLLPCFFMLFLGLFTGSRHYIITTGVAFIGILFVSLGKKKWLALIITASLIVSFLLILQLPVLGSLKEKISRAITTLFGIGSAKYDPSTIQRTIWPQYGFSIGSHLLFFGYGAEGFSIYSGIGTYSHNTYSEIFCNYGLFGTVIFYSAFLYPLALLIRSKNVTIKFGIVIVLFYLTKSFFGVCFNSKDTYLMLALLFYYSNSISLGDYDNKKAISEFTNDSFYEVKI